MPNWAIGQVEVTGKLEDVKKFCKLFIFDNSEIGIARVGKYFARSFVSGKWEDFEKRMFPIETNNLIMLSVSFNVNFAHSAHSCLIEGYPQEYRRECLTLQCACKKYKVEVKIETEEECLGFEETIIANKNMVGSNSTDMLNYTCSCGYTQFVSSSTDLIDVECYDCGENGKGVIK